MTNFDSLPAPLAAILAAAEAGDAAAYDLALESELESAAFEIDEADYVDGVERDALAAAFQQFGFDGIPSLII